jgi:hypothetical protein
MPCFVMQLFKNLLFFKQNLLSLLTCLPQMGVLVVQPVFREGQGAVGLIGAVVQSISSAAHHVCH